MKNIVFIVVLFLCTMCKEKELESIGDYNIRVGDEFSIRISANHSANEMWFWTNRDQITIVDTVDYTYTVTNPELIGSPGTEVWKFKAIQKGLDTLVFSQGNPDGIHAVPVLQTFVVSVQK